MFFAVLALVFGSVAVMFLGGAIMMKGFKIYITSDEVFKVFKPKTYSKENLKGLSLIIVGGLIFAAGFWAPFIMNR